MAEILSFEERISAPARKMTFTNMFALANERHVPNWLITDVMECKTHAMLFGDPESGKSLILFDLMCCIATGKNWRGRPVKQGPVFYLCGEGAAGLGRRAAAWMHHNGMADTEAPLYTSDMPAALTEEDSAEMVRDVIREMSERHGVEPVAIGIDTLARNFGPGDENSAKDIGRFVANIDNHLIGDLGATVITSHHTGHGDKERARGSMSLPGAVDVSYRISKNEKIIQMECKKSKDFEKPAPLIFNLKVVNLGYTDERGRPITGATVEAVEGDHYNSGRPIFSNDTDEKVFDLLVVAYKRTQRHLVSQGRHNEDPVLDIQYWKTEAAKAFDTYGHGPGSDGWNAARRKADRSIKRLIESKHVQYRPNKKDIFPTYCR